MIETLGECDLRMTNQWNGIAGVVSSNKDTKICEKKNLARVSFFHYHFISFSGFCLARSQIQERVLGSKMSYKELYKTSQPESRVLQWVSKDLTNTIIHVLSERKANTVFMKHSVMRVWDIWYTFTHSSVIHLFTYFFFIKCQTYFGVENRPSLLVVLIIKIYELHFCSESYAKYSHRRQIVEKQLLRDWNECGGRNGERS